MKVEAQKSFEKDIGKISNKKFAQQVNEVINELENCSSIAEYAMSKK